MLNRRGFLGALLGAATLDPERLLWVPGKKLISIPNPQGVSLRVLTFFDTGTDSVVHRVDILMGTGHFSYPKFGKVSRDLSQSQALHLIKSEFPGDRHTLDAVETLMRNARDHGGLHALQTLEDQYGRIVGRAIESPVLPCLR